MATAYSLLKSALQLIRVVDKGRDPDQSDINDSLPIFNAFIANWGAQNRLLYHRKLISFTAIAGVGSYTIGNDVIIPLADISTDQAPYQIINATAVDSSNLTYPLIQGAFENYQNVALKTTTSVPTTIYYKPPMIQTTPQRGTIYLYPTPDKAYSINMDCQIYLQAVTLANLTSDIYVRPEYELPWIYNLAIHLTPLFKGEPDPLIVALAEKAEKAFPITPVPIATPDYGIGGLGGSSMQSFYAGE